MNRSGPGIEVGQGAVEDGPRRCEALHGLRETQPGPTQASPGGVLTDTEELGEVAAGELLPVDQLEDDLRLERDAAQRSEQEALFFFGPDERAGSGAEVRDRVVVDVFLAEATIFSIVFAH